MLTVGLSLHNKRKFILGRGTIGTKAQPFQDLKRCLPRQGGDADYTSHKSLDQAGRSLTIKRYWKNILPVWTLCLQLAYGVGHIMKLIRGSDMQHRFDEVIQKFIDGGLLITNWQERGLCFNSLTQLFIV